MIALLLTLFISVFSYSASFNSIEDLKETQPVKNVLEVDSTVHIEGAMSLSSKLNFWKEYASLLYGSDDNVFTQGYTRSSSAQSDSFTIDTSGYAGFKYTTNVQYFTNNGWTNWNDANLLSILTINFANYRGANADYDYLTVIYRLSDGTSREVRMLDFDSGLLSGELVSGINYSSTNTPILYYDAFVFANYTQFHQAYYDTITDFDDGYNAGYQVGVDDGYRNGYQYGYSDGLQTLANNNTTASTIFNGIFEVGLLPVNVFLTIFNFDVFGINVAGVVSSLLTISVIVIILRFVLGREKDGK